MATERGFIAEQLERTALELQSVREKLRSVSDRLSDAEDMLRFYGNPKNYEPVRNFETGAVFQNCLKDDATVSDNHSNTKLAGKRARDYFKRYEIE